MRPARRAFHIAKRGKRRGSREATLDKHEERPRCDVSLYCRFAWENIAPESSERVSESELYLEVLEKTALRVNEIQRNVNNDAFSHRILFLVQSVVSKQPIGN